MSEGGEGRKGFAALAIARLLHRAGVDRAVGFTLLGKAWGTLAFPVTLYLVTTCFDERVQGYYYTFASLLALQVLLELGFDIVMVQFVSHEWIHLRLGGSGRIEGDRFHAARLASLLRLSFFWYAGLAVAFAVVVGAGGHLFLGSGEASGGEHRWPWWVLCITVALSFLVVPLRGAIEGSARIDRSQQIALAASVASAVAGWVAIAWGADLYTPAIVNGVTAAVSLALFAPAFRPYARLMREAKGQGRVCWRGEFWPQQWRIGLSWAAGFFMFQSFVPFLYKTQGPEVAGKMGATLAIYNAVNLFAQSWVYAAGPRFGQHWARREVGQLRDLVRRIYWQTSLVAGVLATGAVGLIVGLRALQLPQAERFADPGSLVLLLATLVALQLSNVETQAVRFRKREPFLGLSLVGAALVVASNAWLGSSYGIRGVTAGFAGVMVLVLIPATHAIYRRETADPSTIFSGGERP